MIVAAGDRIVIGGMVRLLPDDRECAWAEKHLRTDPDLGWILGNFVEADRANDNGHIFPLEDLEKSYQSVLMKPLNVLHQGRYCVGTFVGAELVKEQAEAAAEGGTIVEALAAFWRTAYPEEYELVKRAHSEGALYYSMECIPEELGCVAEDCGIVAKYVGRDSDTYCAHMKGSGHKKLIRPHFGAGALIIPPVRPGWKRADINSVAGFTDTTMLEQVYAAVAEETPHLTPQSWEHMMAQICVQAREFSPKQRENMAKKKQAMPGGSFPIENASDLRNAIQAYGRAKDKAKAKAHIIRRAKALGLTKLLPEGWS